MPISPPFAGELGDEYLARLQIVETGLALGEE
jgi:hypothetical protein